MSNVYTRQNTHSITVNEILGTTEWIARIISAQLHQDHRHLKNDFGKFSLVSNPDP